MQEFDSFFVGDGSKTLLDLQLARKSTAFMGDHTLDRQYEVQDDSEDFVQNRSDIPDDRIQDVFIVAKKAVYERFNFLSIKSASLKGRAIKETDLLLGDTDKYIIDYLKGKVSDFFAIRSVAEMVAYESMGIYEVIFRSKDGCGLCSSFDGSFFGTNNLMRVFTSGRFLTHPYCDCEFFPVIKRSEYAGPLSNSLNIDKLTVGAKEVHNFPVEYNQPFFRELVEKLPFEKISFVNMVEYRNRILSIKDVDNVVVHFNEKENILYIHNDYVGVHGPVSFVRAYLKTEIQEKMDVGKLAGLDRYFLDGRTVVLLEGSYWDLSTGERVK